MIKRLTPKDLDRIVDAGIKAVEGIKKEGIKKSEDCHRISNKARLQKFEDLCKVRKEVAPESLVGKKCTVIKTALMYHTGCSYRIIDSDVFTITKVSSNGTMMTVQTDDGLTYRILTGSVKGVVIWK